MSTGKWIRVAVNGHTIAAKTSALTTLHMLADALGVGFAPHVSAFMAILTTDCHGCAPGGGLLTYRFEEAIRRDAAYASYELCKCAALALRAGAASSAADVRSLFESTLHRLISALRTEASTSVAVALAMAIKVKRIRALQERAHAARARSSSRARAFAPSSAPDRLYDRRMRPLAPSCILSASTARRSFSCRLG